MKTKHKLTELSINLFEMKEYDFFCYVLTDELAPWQVHKQYGQRATSITWIEEAKN